MQTTLSKTALYHYLHRSLTKIFMQPYYQQVVNPKNFVIPFKQSQKDLFFKGNSLKKGIIFVSFDNSPSYKLYQLLGLD